MTVTLRGECFFSSFFFLLCNKQIFDDAYKSQLSCVVVDDIERLLGKEGDIVVKTNVGKED